jgi:hypothetical protein
VFMLTLQTYRRSSSVHDQGGGFKDGGYMDGEFPST